MEEDDEDEVVEASWRRSCPLLLLMLLARVVAMGKGGRSDDLGGSLSRSDKCGETVS